MRSNTTTTERRRHRRTNLNQPGKIFVRRSLRYVGVRAIDVSLGGLLIDVDPSCDLTPGEVLDVVVSDGSSVVVHADDVVPARVVHVRGSADGRRCVGLAFEREGALAALAA